MKFLIIPDLLVSNKIPYIVNACACTQLKCLLATRMCLPTVLSDNYTLSGGGVTPIIILAIQVCATGEGMVFKPFGLVKGMVFQPFGLV